MSVISISQRFDKFEKGCSSIGTGMTSGCKNIIHIRRTLVLKNLKVVKLMHCSKQSCMGSQLIFSNSVKLMWSLIFKFKQKQIHLFCYSVADFSLGFCLSQDTKPNTYTQNEALLLRYREVYEVVETEIYFFYTKIKVQC